jgi:hypothetical protein
VSKFRSLLCLLAVAGCNNPESPSSTRSITSVTWDANHQPVVSTSVVSLGGGGAAGGGFGIDPGCSGNDLFLSDAPLIGGSGSVPKLDPNSNWLCLKNPRYATTIDLSLLPYPSGGNWNGKVRAFMSSTQSGSFLGQPVDVITCEVGFHYYETSNASSCAQVANVVQFDDPNATFTPCTAGSANCSNNTLNTCDQYGEWQSQVCAAGLRCSLQALGCCALPTCGANSCGLLSNACGSAECGDCPDGMGCLNHHCRVLRGGGGLPNSESLQTEQ